MCTDSHQLGQLLIFATGLETIPPLGFEPEPAIRFRHNEDLDSNDKTAAYPISNTCTNTLWLPVVSSYSQFAENMQTAIVECYSFTVA